MRFCFFASENISAVLFWYRFTATMCLKFKSFFSHLPFFSNVQSHNDKKTQCRRSRQQKLQNALQLYESFVQSYWKDLDQLVREHNDTDVAQMYKFQMLICLSRVYRWGRERAGQAKVLLHHSLYVEMKQGLLLVLSCGVKIIRKSEVRTKNVHESHESRYNEQVADVIHHLCCGFCTSPKLTAFVWLN